MCADRIAGAPLIDIRTSGVGDAVVASWVVHSARAVNRLVQINASARRDVSQILGVPEACLTDTDDDAGSVRPDLARLQFHDDGAQPMSAFDVLCRGLGLPRLEPVRPPYVEAPDDGAWADEQWRKIDRAGARARVLIFPEAAWHTRVWPLSYFIDLANTLAGDGHAVAAMAGSQQAVRHMPCQWWGGFPVGKAAAMCRRADLVVGNESGPAHLASTIGTLAVPICGPTDPAVIFGHEPNVRPIRVDPGIVPCVGCLFVFTAGYRHACDVGGCQALMRYDPASASAAVRTILASGSRRTFASSVCEDVMERPEAGSEVGAGALRGEPGL